MDHAAATHLDDKQKMAAALLTSAAGGGGDASFLALDTSSPTAILTSSLGSLPLTHVVGAAVSKSTAREDGGSDVLVFEYMPPSSSLGCGSGSSSERTRRVHTVASGLEPGAAAAWADRITRAAQGVAAGAPLDRQLLVLINPKSGPGRGEALFAELCEPMLRDARCGLTVIVTASPGDASTTLRDMPTASLLRYTAVLAAGGDGTMHEVLAGLLARSDADLVRRSLTLGVLPVGSGNGAAASFCAAAGLPYSVTNAAIMIAQRWESRMDAGSSFVLGAGGSGSGPSEGGGGASGRVGTHLSRHLYSGLPPGQWGDRRFSFLATSFGIVADLDIESEALRCLGASRFDVYGLIRAIFLRRYSGRLSWLPPPSSAPAQGAGGEVGGGKRGEPRGTTDADESLGSANSTSRSGDGVGGIPVTHLLPFNEPLPPTWKSIPGPFTLVWICLTSHQSIGVSAAPRGTHDDGVYTLAIVRDASRCEMASVLLGLDNTGSFTARPGVETHTAVAFRLEPDAGDPVTALGHLCIDGESVPVGPLQSEVLPGFLSVYGPRGTGQRSDSDAKAGQRGEGGAGAVHVAVSETGEAKAV